MRVRTQSHTHTNLSLIGSNRHVSVPHWQYLSIFLVFPRCKYFYSYLRIVLILNLNSLKLTTQMDPKGFFSSVFSFHKHRCCPSVSVSAWWPFSRVAACWLGCVSHMWGLSGTIPFHGCSPPPPTSPPPTFPRLSLTHPPPLNLLALQGSQ